MNQSEALKHLVGGLHWTSSVNVSIISVFVNVYFSNVVKLKQTRFYGKPKIIKIRPHNTNSLL